MIKTNRALSDISKEYSECLPNNWKYKFLVVMHLSSILLYFFNKRQITPDRMFVIESASESNTQEIIALIKTTNYDSRTTLSINKTPTEISKELKSTNDGVALFKGESLIENDRNLHKNINILYDDLTNANGDEENTRHLISIITRFPDKIPESASTFLISFNDAELNFCNDAIIKLQKLSGEFDSALIHYIIRFPADSIKLINDAIDEAKKTAVKTNTEIQNTLIMFHTSAIILKKFGILNEEEVSKIKEYIINNNDESHSSDLKIANEFCHIFNKLIHDGTIKIINQNESPYYKHDEECIFEDEKYININQIVFKELISKRMNSSSKRHQKILKALNNLKLMYSTKNYKRTIKVKISQHESKYIDFYSLSKEILDSQSRAKFEIIRNFDFLYQCDKLPESDFAPIISTYDTTHTAGIQITPDSDENFHVYVTGRSGAGKSYFLVQQALFRTKTDDKIIIFDNGGYFFA